MYAWHLVRFIGTRRAPSDCILLRLDLRWFFVRGSSIMAESMFHAVHMGSMLRCWLSMLLELQPVFCCPTHSDRVSMLWINYCWLWKLRLHSLWKNAQTTAVLMLQILALEPSASSGNKEATIMKHAGIVRAQEQVECCLIQPASYCHLSLSLRAQVSL